MERKHVEIIFGSISRKTRRKEWSSENFPKVHVIGFILGLTIAVTLIKLFDGDIKWYLPFTSFGTYAIVYMCYLIQDNDFSKYFFADLRYRTVWDWLLFVCLALSVTPLPFLLVSGIKMYHYWHKAKGMVGTQPTQMESPIDKAMKVVTEEDYIKFAEDLYRHHVDKIEVIVPDYYDELTLSLAKDANEAQKNFDLAQEKLSQCQDALFQHKAEIAQEIRNHMKPDADFTTDYAKIAQTCITGTSTALAAGPDYVNKTYDVVHSPFIVVPDYNRMEFIINVHREHKGKIYDLGGYKLRIRTDCAWDCICFRHPLPETYRRALPSTLGWLVGFPSDRNKKFAPICMIEEYISVTLPDADTKSCIDALIQSGHIYDAIELIYDTLAHFTENYKCDLTVEDFPYCLSQIEFPQ